MNTPYSDARAIFHAAVRRVQADALLEDAAQRGLLPDASEVRPVRVIGMGKAALAMASALESRRPVAGGCVVVPDGYPDRRPKDIAMPSAVEVRTGGHPAPTYDSIRASRALKRVAEAAGPDDPVVVLVSGGGTTLAALPVDDVALEDVQDVTRKMLLRGVPIQAANAVRKHLLQLGGGQLARLAAPAPVTALVVSDVVGDDLATIASGPTVPDPTAFEDAVRTLYRYDLWHDVTPAVREHLSEGARGRRPETVKSDDPCFETVTTHLIGTNRTALEAAREEATSRGYSTWIVSDTVEGEAAQVGASHAKTLLDEAGNAPVCLLWGGEPTVTVTGNGRGGRNQEAALGAALALDGTNVSAAYLSGGTDGIDGPTDAAGACVTPDTVARAAAQDVDARAHLDANDSHSFFDAVDGLLRPGPTHTNVMDVMVGLVQSG